MQNHITSSSNFYKSPISKDLSRFEITLRGEIKDSKLDVYKAIFITDVVQLIAILGGVLAIVKFMQ